MRNLKERPFYRVIKKFKHWVVVLRERHVTIGSLVIMAKDMSKNRLGKLSKKAWQEFGKVCAFVENLLAKAFGAEKFNYLALMMFDPEVHFHVIPRYSKPVEFMGVEFVDPDWPGPTKRVPMNLDKATLDAIESYLVSMASEKTNRAIATQIKR